MILSHLLCWMEECCWDVSGLSRVLKWRAEGLCVSCKQGSPPPKRSVNTRDLDAKYGQSQKSLISELDTLQLYTGKWSQGDWITCPGVPGWSQFTAPFLVQLTAPPFTLGSVLICMVNDMVTHFGTVCEALPLSYM